MRNARHERRNRARDGGAQSNGFGNRQRAEQPGNPDRREKKFFALGFFEGAGIMHRNCAAHILRRAEQHRALIIGMLIRRHFGEGDFRAMRQEGLRIRRAAQIRHIEGELPINRERAGAEIRADEDIDRRAAQAGVAFDILLADAEMDFRQSDDIAAISHRRQKRDGQQPVYRAERHARLLRQRGRIAQRHLRRQGGKRNIFQPLQGGIPAVIRFDRNDGIRLDFGQIHDGLKLPVRLARDHEHDAVFAVNHDFQRIGQRGEFLRLRRQPVQIRHDFFHVHDRHLAAGGLLLGLQHLRHIHRIHKRCGDKPINLALHGGSAVGQVVKHLFKRHRHILLRAHAHIFCVEIVICDGHGENNQKRQQTHSPQNFLF